MEEETKGQNNRTEHSRKIKAWRKRYYILITEFSLDSGVLFPGLDLILFRLWQVSVIVSLASCEFTVWLGVLLKVPVTIDSKVTTKYII